MIGSAVPLSAIAEALEARLTSATSSQLPVLQRLRRNLNTRCEQIERSVKPTATAPRRWGANLIAAAITAAAAAAIAAAAMF